MKINNYIIVKKGEQQTNLIRFTPEVGGCRGTGVMSFN